MAALIERTENKRGLPPPVLTQELADKLNAGFGATADDDIRLFDLRDWVGKYSGRKPHELPYPTWRALVASLPTREKGALITALGAPIDEKRSLTVGDVRSLSDEEFALLCKNAGGTKSSAGLPKPKFIKQMLKKASQEEKN